MILPATRSIVLLRLSVGLILLLTLSACGLTRPVSSVRVIAPDIDLSLQAQSAAVDWAVQVRRPLADRTRDTERVVIRTGTSRLQTYSGASWLDNAPDMLQAHMIEALQNSGRFAGVSRAGELRSRFVLASELRRFEGVDDGSPDLGVELEIHVRLIDQRDGEIVASRTFSAGEVVEGKQLDALVFGFEQVMQRYFDQLIEWLLTAAEPVP